MPHKVHCCSHQIHDHTATDCNRLQQTATGPQCKIKYRFDLLYGVWGGLWGSDVRIKFMITLQQTETDCNILLMQHNATQSTLLFASNTRSHCNRLQQTATDCECNTMQHKVQIWLTLWGVGGFRCSHEIRDQMVNLSIYCGVKCAVCCSVLQCVAVCCSVIAWDTRSNGKSVYLLCSKMCSVLQCVAVWCSVIAWDTRSNGKSVYLLCSKICSVLQCVAVCCSVLQCDRMRYAIKW